MAISLVLWVLIKACHKVLFWDHFYSQFLLNSAIHLYVDDAILYATAPSVAQAVNNLHLDFCAVHQTEIDLKLLLNSVTQVNINCLNGTLIQRVSCR